MRITAPKNLPILELLALLDPMCSKNTLRSWLEKGRVTFGGKVIRKATFEIPAGQEIAVGRRTEFIQEGVEIHYEDKHLAVVCKPEGLLTVATDFDKSHTLHCYLKRRKQRVFPVHRLDRETSGLLVFAYDNGARGHLKKLFKEHDVVREYHAIVQGQMETPKGTWKSYLMEDPEYVVRQVSSPEQGRLAVTHYEVVSQNKYFSLLRLRLETGRKNQIRVHCKDAGHPIVGDEKYGSTIDPIKRLCLHASKLGFTHPESGKPLLFEIPLPELFYKIIK
jgi:tRNA pseudouridine32 synthase/23S rRNA pseudouridine746 synthase/23S rRNA pseudouridine1911/1915/1917 synthase